MKRFFAIFAVVGSLAVCSCKKAAVVEQKDDPKVSLSQDELEYERREARLKYQLQYNTEISVAREQGLAQGFAKGRSEGEAAGLKKGEAQKQREIAKNLKALNLTKEQIAEATGLSAAEIEKL